MFTSVRESHYGSSTLVAPSAWRGAVAPSVEVLAETWRRQVAGAIRALQVDHPALDRGDTARLVGTLLYAPLPVTVDAIAARATGRYGVWAQQIQAHMTRTGAIARTIARAFDVSADEAFRLGTLHDVGKLVVCDAASTLHVDLGHDPLPTDALVHAAFAALHEPLGGLTLLRWGMEPAAARAVAAHHRSEGSTAGGRASETLYVAERLDLARTRGRAVRLERWIEEGRLTASPNKVAAVIERVFVTAAEGHAVGDAAGDATA